MKHLWTSADPLQITPQRTTITKTKVLATITWPAFKVQPTVVTNTKTLTCSVPKRQNHHDPKATITPTLVSAAALPPTSATPTSAAKKGNSRRRKDIVYRRNADIAQLLAEREARLADAQALDKRGLDVEVVTLTETNTALFSTQTVSTTTSSTLTITATVESTTSMTTITTSTTYKGVTKPVVTVTAVSCLQSFCLTSQEPQLTLFRLAHPDKDKDQVHYRSNDSTRHSPPDDHGQHQVGAGVEHRDLPCEGWQAGVDLLPVNISLKGVFRQSLCLERKAQFLYESRFPQ